MAPHLLEQVGAAGLDLERLGVAIARRPALQHVGDENVLPREADAFQQLVEELARAADERQALAVLFGSRRLADEHHIGVSVPGAEHRLAARLVQWALRARLHLFVEADQLSPPLLGRRAHRRGCYASGQRLPGPGCARAQAVLLFEVVLELGQLGRLDAVDVVRLGKVA